MSRKKEYDLGPGQTNPETTDAAAEGGSDHNEALAQRPDGSTQSQQDDQAAIEALRRTSESTAALTTAGQTTTTTPDSVNGSTGGDAQDGPGNLDAMTADERLERVRGWARGKRTQSVMSADWQDLEEILGSPAAGERRRP